MVYIYILQLQDNKYYVGKTNNPDVRLDKHFDGDGSTWTSKYPPLNIIDVISNCDDYDENKYTIMYMEKHGIDNVRGGSFCQVNLSKENIATLNKMIKGSNDSCYNCGEIGHFINKCPNKNVVFNCKYCDKSFDTKNGMQFHINMHCKLNPKHVKNYDNNTQNFQCEYCNKLFDTKNGMQFHINIHCKLNPKHIKNDDNNTHNFQCEYCNKIFYTQDSMNFHINMHCKLNSKYIEDNIFRCDHCNAKCSNQNNLNSHINIYCKMNANSEYCKKIIQSFSCQYCSMHFKTNESMKIHENYYCMLNPEYFKDYNCECIMF